MFIGENLENREEQIGKQKSSVISLHINAHKLKKNDLQIKWS